MLTNADAVARAIAALEAVGRLDVTTSNAIRAAFEPYDNWYVEEYDTNDNGYRWRLRNQRTGELYTSPVRNGRRRFVTFKNYMKAAGKAYLMNLEGSVK